MRKSKKRKLNSTASSSQEPKVLTFMDHVRELRSRLVWVALWFIVATGTAFPFFKDIIKLLMRPLGDEKLYYLTPIGGVSFAIKVCMYVGMVATIPILVYHTYQFISPVMRRRSAKRALLYVSLSTLLAAIGIAFAYIVSLPSAIHFLTNFNLGNVNAMLTVDSYLSFIVAYVLASALMFQIPLLMVIIDKVTPTPPSTWNKYQRHMIVAAFIIAMLISPSPEITTQVTLAVPIILMYQLGLMLVWLRHRNATVKSGKVEKAAQRPLEKSLISDPIPAPVAPTVPVSAQTLHRSVTPGRVDVLMPYKPVARMTSIVVPPRSQTSLSSQVSRSKVPRTSIDGFLPARDS